MGGLRDRRGRGSEAEGLVLLVELESLLVAPEDELVDLVALRDLLDVLLHRAVQLAVRIVGWEAAQEPADVVFFSTPDGVGMVQARAELEKGAKVIDYSGDFRFASVEDYAEYARRIGKDVVDSTAVN